MDDMDKPFIVGQIMTRNVVTVSPDDNVYRAAALMAERGVSSCVVVRDEKPVGVVTERDLVRKVLAMRLSPVRTKVAAVMSYPVIVVGENTSVLEAIDIMARNSVRRVVVVKDDRLVGIVTITDLVRALREYEIEKIAPAVLRVSRL